MRLANTSRISPDFVKDGWTQAEMRAATPFLPPAEFVLSAEASGNLLLPTSLCTRDSPVSLLAISCSRKTWNFLPVFTRSFSRLVWFKCGQRERETNRKRSADRVDSHITPHLPRSPRQQDTQSSERPCTAPGEQMLEG
ncbi:unnamed protein product [Pleuronectes platessa]|uniref:Uncharacterized protein n=1 Tax=Pleuronectes platessa TaxID=8262 RepID=A0A9N7YEV6_PLEPL|nr:unnamed protein product [Pleuronectes platessa]